MKKMLPAFASLLLILPLTGIAALAIGGGEAEQRDVGTSQGDESADYRCCWFFHNGMWYCIPC